MNDFSACSASAPGKLVLLGEYAVTRGMPALSMAVNKRAQARSKASANKQHQLTTSMASGSVYSFTKRHGNYNWVTSPPEQIKSFVEHLPWPATSSNNFGIHLDLDSRPFFQPGSAQKTGIGSSAALMLAANAVLGHTIEDARKAHLTMQQSGSGIDVSSSLNGGLILFQQLQAAQHLQLPANFFWRAVWTGNSAETRTFLQEFDFWIGRHPADWDNMKLLAAPLMAEAITAIGKNDGLALTACIRAYGEWMRELGEQIEAPIYTPAYETIRKLTMKSNCGWKPSGAGGGDIGLICAASSDDLIKISRTISDAGYTILDLELEMDGLKVVKQ